MGRHVHHTKKTRSRDMREDLKRQILLLLFEETVGRKGVQYARKIVRDFFDNDADAPTARTHFSTADEFARALAGVSTRRLLALADYVQRCDAAHMSNRLGPENRKYTASQWIVANFTEYLRDWLDKHRTTGSVDYSKMGVRGLLDLVDSTEI